MRPPMRWTPSADALLVRLYEAGDTTVAHIAVRFGCHPSSVRNRAVYLRQVGKLDVKLGDRRQPRNQPEPTEEPGRPSDEELQAMIDRRLSENRMAAQQ